MWRMQASLAHVTCTFWPLSFIRDFSLLNCERRVSLVTDSTYSGIIQQSDNAMHSQIQAIWQVISSCLPVFLLIFLGWLSVHRRYVGKEAKSLCSTLVSNYVFPALLFIHTATTSPAEVFDGRWMLAFAISMALLWAVSFATNMLGLKHTLKQSTMQAMLCSFPNMGGMGVPFLILLLGPGSTISVAIANFVVALSLIPGTIFLLELSDSLATGRRVDYRMVLRALRNALIKPMFIGVMLGVLVSMTHATQWLPAFVFNTGKIMSDACNFISLFAVGVAIYGVKLRISRALLLNLGLKSLIAPLISWFVVFALGIQGVSAQELIFLLAMPTATNATILAYQWHVQEDEASGLYMLSTALSVIVLPTLMLLMQAYIPGAIG